MTRPSLANFNEFGEWIEFCKLTEPNELNKLTELAEFCKLTELNERSQPNKRSKPIDRVRDPSTSSNDRTNQPLPGLFR